MLKLEDIISQYLTEPYNWRVQIETSGYKESIILNFKSHEEYFLRYLSYYQKLNSIQEVIKEACIGNIIINQQNRAFLFRHTHQNIYILNGKQIGIPISLAIQVSENIINKNLSEINNATTFEEIYSIINRNSVSGFGPLAKYDATLRIASTKGIIPYNLYLHTGSQKGLSFLIDHGYLSNEFSQHKIIDINKLPFEFSRMNAMFIEDFLCIKKNELERNLQKR